MTLANSKAPTGRKTKAQGNALGNRTPMHLSPEWAEQGWRIVKLEDVADIRSGNGFPIKYQGRTEGEFPFFKVGDISRNWQKGMITLTNGEHCLTQSEVKAIRAKTLPEGSVVFAKIGAAVALNRRAILGVESLVDNNVMALVPSAMIMSRYLFYFMCQVDLGASTRGGTVPSLRRGDVADLQIPLPPLPEQRRIVARIEELFSRLDAGVAALREAKAQLQRYRQSVLAAAVTGQLTQAWREQHPDTEPLEELYSRITNLRKAGYQWQCDEAQKADQPKPKKPTNLEFAPTDERILFNYPQSWALPSIDGIGAPTRFSVVDGPFGSDLKVSDYSPDGTVPVLTISMFYDTDQIANARCISDKKYEKLKRSRVVGGDLLVAKIGNTYGLTCIYPSRFPTAIIPANICKITPDDQLVDSAYLKTWLDSWLFKALLDQIVSASAQPAFSVQNFKRLPVPLPPLAEQHQIVAEVEARTTAIDHLEAELDRQITRSNRLRQSTLQSAFCGKLI